MTRNGLLALSLPLGLGSCLPAWPDAAQASFAELPWSLPPAATGEAAPEGEPAAAGDLDEEGLPIEEPPAPAWLEGRGTEGAQPQRTGTPPSLQLEGLERRRSPCGWQVDLPGWVHLGDRATRAAGLGRASPVELLEGEQLLRRRNHEDVEAECLGLFVHTTRRLVFSPSFDREPESAEATPWQARLSPQLPMQTVDGRELWWVYPGTSLELSPPLTGTLAARVAVVRLGEGAPPRLVAAGQVLDLRVEGDRAEGELGFVAAQEGWTLRVEVPEDGATVVVEALSLRSQRGARALIGELPEGLPWGPVLVGAALSLAPSMQPPPALEEGAEDLDEDDADEVPELPLAPGSWGKALSLARLALPRSVPELSLPLLPKVSRDGWARAEVPELEALGERNLARLGLGGRASPVRILEDGRALEYAKVGCQELRQGTLGGSCHAHSAHFYASSDGSDPATNGHRYSLGLDPGRTLDGGRWLYPGDLARLELDSLPTAVRLAGRLVAVGDGVSLGIEAVRDGTVLARAEVLVAELGPGGVVVELEPEPGASPGPVTLRLRLEDAWLALTELSLEKP